MSRRVDRLFTTVSAVLLAGIALAALAVLT